MAEGFNNVQRICEIGPRCKEKKNNVLGDTQYGIHMNRHYDILTRFMVFKNFQQANYLVILRVKTQLSTLFIFVLFFNQVKLLIFSI